MIEARLHGVLERARTHGFLGPGPVSTHVEHARGFAQVIESSVGVPGLLLDLGSGGGIPGLVLAETWPSTQVLLLDAKKRRTAFLTDAIHELGWAHRVRVRRERAESAAHDAALRESFDAVTARGFGPPATTAEIAAGFVRISGVAVVSEPPEAVADRWSVSALSALGFDVPIEKANAGGHFVVLTKTRATPAHWPRPEGKPGKRRLF